MPIEPYSLDELNSIGDANIKTEIPEIDSTVPGSFSRAFVGSNAILIYAAQKNIQAALDDFFPQTATGEFLDFWAGINALTRVPGTVSEGRASLAGVLTTAVPIGTLFASSEGDNYSSTSAVVVDTHVGSITLTKSGTTITAVSPVAHSLVNGLLTTITGAVDTDYNITDAAVTAIDQFTFTYVVPSEPAAGTDSGAYSSVFADIPVESVAIGSDKNIVAGALLTLQSTVSGFDDGDQATANRDGITAGSDLEDDDSLRDRVLKANAIDPGVFTNAQIRLDALTIPTATRVFITNPSLDYTTDGTPITNRAVTSITQAAGTATALITDTSNMYVGSTITISGATDTDYNEDWIVLSIVANTSFTFAIDSGTGSPAGGTILLDLNIYKNIPQPGSVYVFVLDDNNDPPTPSATTLTNVKDKIIIKLPAHATEASVHVVAPSFDDVAITITGLSPNTAAMQAAISDSLSAFFQDEVSFAEPVKLNKIISAIQNTQDLETKQFVDEFTLASPTEDVEIGNGSMGSLGTVTIS